MSERDVRISYDVIVVGSGLGGLTAAALLAKRGKKVLVLEQHTIPGGCATTFQRKNYKIEVGLNAFGGMDADDAKLPYFKELEIDRKVKFLRLNEFYAYSGTRGQFIMPNTYPGNMEALQKHFPEESENIARYFRRILKVRKQLNRYCCWSFRKQQVLLCFLPFVLPAVVRNMFSSAGGVVNRSFKNPELRKILLANRAYFHDDPMALSFLYFAAGQGEYYKGGAYYIQGGSQCLSNHLVKKIEDNNGCVSFRSEVVGVNILKGRVTGVSYLKKNGAKSHYHEVEAPVVIANASIPQVANAFLDKKYSKLLSRKVKKQSLSPSFFLVFLAFKRPLSETGSGYYSSFFEGNAGAQNHQLGNREAFFRNTSFYFCDYSRIDARLSTEAIGQGVICCNDRIERWEGLSREEYHRQKERMAELLIDRLEAERPGLMSQISHYEIGTPKTVERFIRTPGGAVYGFAQTCRQAVPFRQSVKSGITGLYFASAWAFPGGGFSGSMLSGMACANAIGAKK